MIKVCVFSGGRGSLHILEGLTRSSAVSLTVLVNAYDDGLSTGRVRRSVGKMLGPSDIRKNYAHLLHLDGRATSQALAKVLEYRIETREWTPEKLNTLIFRFEDLNAELPEPIQGLRRQLTVHACEGVASALKTFGRERGADFDYEDCAIGNLVLAGLHLREGFDFNRATDRLQDLEPCSHRVVNVTQGEPLRLCGITASGEWLKDEASIVTDRGPEAPRIEEIFLVPEESPAPGSIPEARAMEIFPQLNPMAKALLEEADAILYAPGTQHSSLLPSYMTSGLSEVISKNKRAKKIFVYNLLRDHDLAGETAEGLFEKFFHYFSIKGTDSIQPAHLLDEVFAPISASSSQVQKEFELTEAAIQLLKNRGIQIVRQPFESRAKIHHLPGQVANALIERASSRAQARHYSFNLVTVIIPVLNEAARLKAVLEELRRSSWPKNMKVEFIVVDGRSTDSTRAEAMAFAEIDSRFSVLECSKPGRGAAIQRAISETKGDIVCVFHGDGEYDVEDLVRAIEPICNHSAFAALGSRMTYQPDPALRLRTVYGRHRWMAKLSQYGGLFLGLGIHLFFQRPISDPLSGIKVFNGNWLRKHCFKRPGVDWDIEVLLELFRENRVLVEVPVRYRPRTVSEGKKTRIWDGIRCLYAIFLERWNPPSRNHDPFSRHSLI